MMVQTFDSRALVYWLLKINRRKSFPLNSIFWRFVRTDNYAQTLRDPNSTSSPRNHSILFSMFLQLFPTLPFPSFSLCLAEKKKLCACRSRQTLKEFNLTASLTNFSSLLNLFTSRTVLLGSPLFFYFQFCFLFHLFICVYLLIHFPGSSVTRELLDLY